MECGAGEGYLRDLLVPALWIASLWFLRWEGVRCPLPVSPPMHSPQLPSLTLSLAVYVLSSTVEVAQGICLFPLAENLFAVWGQKLTFL